jgi:hypothetical protein
MTPEERSIGRLARALNPKSQNLNPKAMNP